MEQTFIMIKPDGVQRRLVGECINRFERRGLKLTAVKMVHITTELAGKHYAEHVGKGFYSSLIDYITSGPVVAMVWTGPQAVQVGRQLLGKTDPGDAAPGTIRFDFGLEIGRNIIHGSADADDARREIDLFFSRAELNEYEMCDDEWITE